MKVLLVSVKNEASHGGIAVWTESYLKGCATNGIETDIVNIQMRGRRATDGTAKRSLLDELCRTKDIFAQLRRYLKHADSYAVAHLNTSCGTFGLLRDLMVARKIVKKGIALVTHYHCDISNCVGNPRSRNYLHKLASLSKVNLVLNQNSSRYLLDNFGISSVSVPNFIEDSLILDQHKMVRKKLERVLFVGRVEPSKGAAEIYALAERFPELTFALVGAVRQEVAGWQKPNNVELLGTMPHEQVVARMDEADAFLFPSHSEGFSVALMESMARGLPAIATDVGAAADMLSDGCGIVVPKGDVDAMERALKALEDPQLRQSICSATVEKVRRCYTTDAVMKLLISVYGCKE